MRPALIRRNPRQAPPQIRLFEFQTLQLLHQAIALLLERRAASCGNQGMIQQRQSSEEGWQPSLNGVNASLQPTPRVVCQPLTPFCQTHDSRPNHFQATSAAATQAGDDASGK